MELNIITIDGPAGSGKSTVAKQVARELGWKYLDTGVMYRGLTFALLKFAENKNLPFNDNFVLLEIKNLTWDVKIINQTDNAEPRTIFILNKKEIADSLIRSKKVESNINKISDKIEIRQMCLAIQRRFGLEGKLVTEGRDQGSTVFPDAKYKFYLDASVKVRTERRLKDFKSRGDEINFENLVADIERRDESDKNRTFGALKIPKNAIMIDTSNMSVKQVVSEIISYVH